MKLFYAERLGGEGEPYIAERGVFTSLEEFAPYRRRGWEGTIETNSAVDAYIDSLESGAGGNCAKNPPAPAHIVGSA